MVTTGASMLAAVAFAVLTALAAVAFVVFIISRSNMDRTPLKRPSKKAPEAEAQPYLTTLAARIAALEVKVEDLPGLWADERERMRRHADRAQQAERDLEKRLAKESDEGEADEGDEDDVLPLWNGFGGGASGLQPVPNGVAQPADDLKARAAQVLSYFGRR